MRSMRAIIYYDIDIYTFPFLKETQRFDLTIIGKITLQSQVNDQYMSVLTKSLDVMHAMQLT